MIVTKRTQGRPPRNSGINGRERLIEATRTYLQTNRKMSLTRTEIAQGCGVTPALISYYFKDKRSLLDAVTKPLLRAYRARMSLISASSGSTAERMLGVIRLLIELNTDDAFLVDHLWWQASQKVLDDEDQVTVHAFKAVITNLIEDLLARGDWQEADVILLETALWGICRALGETLRLERDAAHANTDDLLERRASFVYATFTARASAHSLHL